MKIGLAAITTVGIILAAIQLAAASPAETPPLPNAAPAAKEKPAVTPVKPVKPGELTGTWSGLIAEVGRAKQYPLTITLAGKAGTTTYPDQKCAGKLTRVGLSGDYAFFAEKITDGKFDPAKKTGCLDGVLTLMPSAGGLVFGWLAGFEGKPIVAYGSLAPKP